MIFVEKLFDRRGRCSWSRTCVRAASPLIPQPKEKKNLRTPRRRHSSGRVAGAGWRTPGARETRPAPRKGRGRTTARRRGPSPRTTLQSPRSSSRVGGRGFVDESSKLSNNVSVFVVAFRGRAGGGKMHGATGASGGGPTRGPGVFPDLGPPRAPPDVFFPQTANTQSPFIQTESLWLSGSPLES